MTVASNAARPARADSIFFPGIAFAMAALVFVGFAPSWFLRAYFPQSAALSPLIVIHGAVFTLWVLLFIVQTSLIAANRRDIHRKLGWWGVGLAVAMVVLGWMAAVNSLRHGVTPLPGIPPAAFFAVPVGSLVAFMPLVLLGILNRKRSDYHKRYLLMSMITVLIPAAARIFLGSKIPPILAAYAVADIFVLALLAYDSVKLGKVHRATWTGSAILIASEPGRLMIGQTHWWQSFASLFA
jgi:FtsH-binding integral membrane protein